MNSKLIIRLTGKMCQVSRDFALICQEYGHLTLGELAQDDYGYGYFVFEGVA